MTRKRTVKAAVDRAREYIDSALMGKRLKHGRNLVVRIIGNYGVYTTRLRLGRRPEGRCTCPSDWAPCKHVLALEATWKLSPQSFLDLDAYLRQLSTKSKEDLVKLISRMALAAPESLAACGFREFEPEREEGDFE